MAKNYYYDEEYATASKKPGIDKDLLRKDFSKSLMDSETDKVFNEYENEESDWSSNIPQRAMKKSHEMYGDLIRPATALSYKLIKGTDPETKKIRTGFGFSGFEEANTSDLTTSNLLDDLQMGTEFVNMCNIILSELEEIQVLYNIDTRPTYRNILNQRSMYASTSKSVKGKLLEALTIERSEQTVRSRNYNANNQNKKKGGLFSSKNNDDYDSADSAEF